MLTEKRCSRCREVKPASAFHVARTRKTGLYPSCKACRAAGTPRLTREQRFWEKVAKRKGRNACWEWTASSSGPMGYGAFFTDQRTRTGRSTMTPAHRYSYTIHAGSIPEGQCVLHKCDNPLCVRPSHLFLGTRAENNADRDRKGRHGTKGRVKVDGKYQDQEAKIVLPRM